MTESVFAKYQAQSYPYQFRGQLEVHSFWGAIPTDPKAIEGWIKTNLSPSNEVLLQEMVAEVVLETGLSRDEAVKIVGDTRSLCGFKRDPSRNGEFFYEGRCLKSCLKEAASVAANEGKIASGKAWGNAVTKDNKENKGMLRGLISWFPEHVFVKEDNHYLGVYKPDDIDQSFLHKFSPQAGREISAISYNERLDVATLDFSVETDHDFGENDWAMIWTTAERLGIGAGRSQGHGKFVVTEWEQVP